MPNMHFIFNILLSYFIRLFKEGLNAFSLKGPKYPFLQRGSPKMNFLFCLRDAVLYFLGKKSLDHDLANYYPPPSLPGLIKRVPYIMRGNFYNI